MTRTLRSARCFNAGIFPFSLLRRAVALALISLALACATASLSLAQADAPIDSLLNAIAAGEKTSSIVERIAQMRDVNAASSQGYTLLMGVSRVSPERMDLFSTVLERRPDIGARSDAGETSLFLAAAAGNDNIVRALIARGDLDSRSTAGGTPITRAALNHRWSTVEILMLAGANLDVADASERTPLQFASIAARWDIVARLLEHGASPNLVDNVTGNSPLMWAANYGNLEMAKLLIAKGANPDVLNPYLCTTALHYAAYSGNVELINFLAAQRLQRDAPDRHGNTALSVAIANRRDAAAAALRALHIPEHGEPFELCTSRPLSAQPPRGMAPDMTARTRDIIQRWQSSRVRLIDARIIAGIVTEEELFRLTLCSGSQNASSCRGLLASEPAVAGIINAYLDDRFLSGKTPLRSLGARLSDAIGVDWSRTKWPVELRNPDWCGKLPAGQLGRQSYYLDGEGAVPIASPAAGFCLTPGNHTVLTISADKTWKLLDLEYRLDAGGPRLIARESPGSPIVVANRITGPSIRACSEISSQGRDALKRPPARDLSIQDRSSLATTFSIALQVSDPASRCAGSCRAILGRTFLQALLQWAGACHLCAPSNFAIVTFDGRTFVDFSRLALSPAVHNIEDMNRLLAGIQWSAHREYQEFSRDSAAGRMFCDQRAPQFLRDELCGGTSSPAARPAIVLELQEGGLICGESSEYLVACGSQRKIQLNTKFMVFTGVDELKVASGELVRHTLAIGIGPHPTDLRAVLVHELGHFFGLPHADESGQDVMAQYYNEAGACMTADDTAMLDNAVDQRWPYRLIECSGLRRSRQPKQ